MAESRIWRIGTVAVLGLVLAASLIAAGCSSQANPPPAASRQATYTVRHGDTLYRIAKHYNLSVGRLMTANGISSARDIYVGQVLTIPGTYSTASLGRSEDYSSEHPTRIFAWPISQGIISSGFGIRNGTMHDGVDISAPIGTPVQAAESGSVIYSGRLRGYGDVIIVRHDDHYVTVYGHDSSNLVREGDYVARGQVIGRLGATGHTTGANLHFEVRRDNVARNPLAYLPRPEETAGITFARNSGS